MSYLPSAIQADHYLDGDCAVCGRARLMPWYLASDGKHRDERLLVGIECEKCHATWRLGGDTATPSNPYGAWPHPITGEET